MILPGSYQNGFAPRDGQPLYPELWRGCVGAWAPCLGPTGLTLRDWSGFGNHGTLTNMIAGDDWLISPGRYALDFDGSNDRVQTLLPVLSSTGDFSMSAWLYPTSFVKDGTVCGNYGAGNTTGVQLIIASATGRQALYVTSGATFIGTQSLTLNAWNVVIAMRTSGVIEIFVNGVSGGTATRSGAIGTSRNFAIGSTPDSTGEEFAGRIAEVMVHSRAVSAGERKLISMRPGIAYELAPRRRSSSAVQFNRRRRLLVGAH